MSRVSTNILPTDRSLSNDQPGSIEIQSEIEGSVIVTDTASLSSTIEDMTSYKKYFVIGVAGQSNAVGYDESPLSSRNMSRNKKRILQLGAYGEDNLKLIPLDHCAQNIQDLRTWAKKNNKSSILHGTKGLHLPLANLLLDYIPDDYAIVIIPVAHGETGFTDSRRQLGNFDAEKKLPEGYEADRTGNNNQVRYNWGLNSAYSKTLVERIKHVMSLGDSANNIFGGIIWIQGETDNRNASNHKTKFIEMADNIIEQLNTAIGTKTIRKQITRDMWFNVETTIYWNNISGCKTIWNNYKEFSPNSYVSVKQAAHLTNRITKSTATSSTMEAHYGGDSYIDYVAPAILQKMIDQGVVNFGDRAPDLNGEFREIVDSDYVKKTRNADDLSSYLRDTVFIGTKDNAPGFWLDPSITGLEFKLGSEMAGNAGVLIIVGDDGYSEAHTSIYFGRGTTASNNKFFYGAKTSISFTSSSSHDTGLSFLSNPVSGDTLIRIEKMSETSIKVTVGSNSGVIDFAAANKQGPSNVFTSHDKARIRFGFCTHFTTQTPVHLVDIKVRNDKSEKLTNLIDENGDIQHILYRLRNIEEQSGIRHYIEKVNGYGIVPESGYVYSEFNGIISTYTTHDSFTFTRNKNSQIFKSVFNYGGALPASFIANLVKIPFVTKSNGITINVKCRLTGWHQNYATPGLFSLLNNNLSESVMSIGINKETSTSQSVYAWSKKIGSGELTTLTTAKGTLHQLAIFTIVLENTSSNMKISYYVNGESINADDTINSTNIEAIGGVLIGGAVGYHGTSAEYEYVNVIDRALSSDDIRKFYQ